MKAAVSGSERTTPRTKLEPEESEKGGGRRLVLLTPPIQSFHSQVQFITFDIRNFCFLVHRSINLLYCNSISVIIIREVGHIHNYICIVANLEAHSDVYLILMWVFLGRNHNISAGHEFPEISSKFVSAYVIVCTKHTIWW
ncbi:hypothetical protein Y032_0004g1986 [Ancylostoma ceylanicum]|uniref:Uncharacterized protein n=1 Tax=Ancylostoma ceylanicum TaxID=53326 RepID=A0A016VWN1_9BILA|nr:hypothetical protein Y032_0004g1986 [Ancylostoma ceylanicum]